MDREDDLFKTFHLLAVKAIKIIAKHFYTSSKDNAKDNRYLSKWMLCDFCGEEAFDDVTASSSNNITGIDGYIGYLQKIPYLSNLFFFREVSQDKYAIVTMLH